jgi:hypothetical protein
MNAQNRKTVLSDTKSDRVMTDDLAYRSLLGYINNFLFNDKEIKKKQMKS